MSIDADVNYIGAADRKTMLEERPKIEQAIDQIARSQGYKIEKSSPEHAGQKCYLRYTNAFGEKDEIQIDLNFLNRVPIFPPKRREMWLFWDVDPIEVLLCHPEEIVAGKFNALIDRVAARDYFDVSFVVPTLFTEGWPPKSLKRTFVFFSGVLNHPINPSHLDRLDRLPQEYIDKHLRPVLPQDQSLNAHDLIERAREVLRPFLDLEDHEKEYVERIQFGEYMPELLFSDEPEFLEALRSHPALLWKAQNKQRYQVKLKGELPWEAK